MLRLSDGNQSHRVTVMSAAITVLLVSFSRSAFAQCVEPDGPPPLTRQCFSADPLEDHFWDVVWSELNECGDTFPGPERHDHLGEFTRQHGAATTSLYERILRNCAEASSGRGHETDDLIVSLALRGLGYTADPAALPLLREVRDDPKVASSNREQTARLIESIVPREERGRLVGERLLRMPAGELRTQVLRDLSHAPLESARPYLRQLQPAATEAEHVYLEKALSAGPALYSCVPVASTAYRGPHRGCRAECTQDGSLADDLHRSRRRDESYLLRACDELEHVSRERLVERQRQFLFDRASFDAEPNPGPPRSASLTTAVDAVLDGRQSMSASARPKGSSARDAGAWDVEPPF